MTIINGDLRVAKGDGRLLIFWAVVPDIAHRM